LPPNAKFPVGAARFYVPLGKRGISICPYGCYNFPLLKRGLGEIIKWSQYDRDLLNVVSPFKQFFDLHAALAL
jgi:hypothetical protein